MMLKEDKTRLGYSHHTSRNNICYLRGDSAVLSVVWYDQQVITIKYDISKCDNKYGFYTIIKSCFSEIPDVGLRTYYHRFNKVAVLTKNKFQYIILFSRWVALIQVVEVNQKMPIKVYTLTQNWKYFVASSPLLPEQELRTKDFYWWADWLFNMIDSDQYTLGSHSVSKKVKTKKINHNNN